MRNPSLMHFWLNSCGLGSCDFPKTQNTHQAIFIQYNSHPIIFLILGIRCQLHNLRKVEAENVRENFCKLISQRTLIWKKWPLRLNIFFNTTQICHVHNLRKVEAENVRRNWGFTIASLFVGNLSSVKKCPFSTTPLQFSFWF